MSAAATPNHIAEDGGRGCRKQAIARSEVATISHSNGRMLSIQIRDTSSLAGLVYAAVCAPRWPSLYFVEPIASSQAYSADCRSLAPRNSNRATRD